MVDRQQHLGTRSLENPPGDVDLVLLDARRAHRDATRLQERVRHRAADQERVHLADQLVDDLDLVADFRATEDGEVRLRRAFQQRLEVLQLGRNEKTRAALGDVLHHPDRRRVRAMDGAERVVDVDLRQRRQLARKLVVVRFLLGVKAQVLQQQHLPFTQLSDQLAHAVADAVVGKAPLFHPAALDVKQV